MSVQSPAPADASTDLAPLRDRIRRDGKVLPGGILKVDSFINHQVDPALMALVGREFARRFGYLRPTKVLTAEISGIAPALQAGVALDVPVVFARKTRSVTLPPDTFERHVPSRTKGGETLLLVSPEYLGPTDRIIVIDDFLASARPPESPGRHRGQAGATLLGIGCVVEKSFEGWSSAPHRVGRAYRAWSISHHMDERHPLRRR
ncbi:MAG: xanthine phosphoribosyltransferase [Anaerolineae bacterium]|nr:xanthine phosphoribosyltransferase [Anaerolineae bacterium]